MPTKYQTALIAADYQQRALKELNAKRKAQHALVRARNRAQTINTLLRSLPIDQLREAGFDGVVRAIDQVTALGDQTFLDTQNTVSWQDEGICRTEATSLMER